MHSIFESRKYKGYMEQKCPRSSDLANNYDRNLWRISVINWVLCEKIAQCRYCKFTNILNLIQCRLHFSQQETDQEMIFDKIFCQYVIMLQICSSTEHISHIITLHIGIISNKYKQLLTMAKCVKIWTVKIKTSSTYDNTVALKDS